MLGLGSSTAVDPARYSAAAAAYDRTLPFEGSYIYFEQPFAQLLDSGGAYPAIVEAWDTITIDDSVMEQFPYEGSDMQAYSEQHTESYTGSGIWGKYTSDMLNTGDTVVITGFIVRADNNLPWNGEDTSQDGFITMRINSADVLTVYIDLQNESDITSLNVDRVDSTGAFRVEKQLTVNNGNIRIDTNDIASIGGYSAIDEPRIRIKNLRLTKS